MFYHFAHRPMDVSVKLLISWVVLFIMCAPVFAQSEQKVTLTLNHDHIVAGEPLLLRCQITGVPSNASLQFKDRDKGWISVRLLDADGQEVGTFERDTTKSVLAATTFNNVISQTNATIVSPPNDDGLRYIVPNMTIDHRVIIPQTNAVVKPGIYRLFVRVRLFGAIKPNGPPPANIEEFIAQEPKTYHLIKVSAVFRVAVTSADPAALAKKATELRDTIGAGLGPKVLDAAHELIEWPSISAVQEWRTLAKDEHCKMANLEMFAGMLAFDGSPNAIKFLGELTWDMNKLNMRGALIQRYFFLKDNSIEPAVQKQIAGLFAIHGEDISNNLPRTID